MDAGLDDVLVSALSTGCHALLLEMPRNGGGGYSARINRNPGRAVLPDGTVFDFSNFNQHEYFAELELILGVTLLSIFVQPVVDAVSQIKRDYPKSKIFMVGLSGGAWTTHVAAALDPRINWSMAVAGSEPIESAAYDYEQRHVLLSRLFGYSRIYALAGSHNRTHLHIYNMNDTCCFRPKSYLGMWQRGVLQLANVMNVQSAYVVKIDESASKHEIGSDALSLYEEALRK